MPLGRTTIRVPLTSIRRRRLLELTAGLFGGLVALGGCIPLTTANDLLVGRDGYTQWRGLAYGNDPRQVLDVYSPNADRSPARTSGVNAARVVVFFYGGAWRSGTRDHYRFIGKAFTDAGFVVVVPDYRLSPAVRFPAFNEDGAAAVRWVRDHIAGYGGNPDDIVLMGHSAGAHIAALLVTDRRYLRDAGVPTAAIHSFVGLAGPYAIDPLQYRVSRPAFEGADPPAVAKPITHVDGDEPPMLLLHGGDDRTVWPLNSHALADKVNACGGSAQVIEYPDTGHIGILLGLSELFRSPDGAFTDTLRFIGGSTATVTQPAASSSRTASSDACRASA